MLRVNINKRLEFCAWSFLSARVGSSAEISVQFQTSSLNFFLLSGSSYWRQQKEINREPSPSDERWHGKEDVTLKWTTESYFGLRIIAADQSARSARSAPVQLWVGILEMLENFQLLWIWSRWGVILLSPPAAATPFSPGLHRDLPPERHLLWKAIQRLRDGSGPRLWAMEAPSLLHISPTNIPEMEFAARWYSPSAPPDSTRRHASDELMKHKSMDSINYYIRKSRVILVESFDTHIRISSLFPPYN